MSVLQCRGALHPGISCATLGNCEIMGKMELFGNLSVQKIMFSRKQLPKKHVFHFSQRRAIGKDHRTPC